MTGINENVALDCSSAACRSPERRPRGGMSVNDGCQCSAGDLARAHERMASRLRASPQAAREIRGPRLVSYAPDRSTCTLNFNGDEYYYNLASTPNVDLDGDALAAKLTAVWQPIETAPDDKIVEVGWLDADDHETPERREFDYKEDGVWVEHEGLYQEFCAVAPSGSRGPSEQAPYTYWLDVPPLPGAPNSGKPE